MTATGRPLRFLAIVLGGWVAMRLVVWILPPGRPPPAPIEFARSPAAPSSRMPSGHASPAALAPDSVAAEPVSYRHARGRHPLAPIPRPWSVSPPPALPWEPFSEVAVSGDGEVVLTAVDLAGADDLPNASFGPAPLPSESSQTRRWSVSTWWLWRPEAGAFPVFAPLLGGSQAGLRLDYRFSNRFGLYARASRAFARPFAEEAAAGIAFRPVSSLPVSLMAERRQKLGEGARSAFAIMAAGGIGPVEIGPRGELEGYAQAGLVGLREADGFADGRLSLAYRLTARDRKPDLAIGLSAWASAQPGAQRVDIGPELRLRVPVGPGRLRLSAEWRERIVGEARPASGPAVTLIAEF